MVRAFFFLFFLFFVQEAFAAPTLISSSQSTGPAGADDNEEELLAKVFGAKREQKDVMMEFVLSLDGEKVGDVMVMVGKTNKVFAQSVKEALGEYITEDMIKKIDTMADKNGFIPFDALNKSGFEIVFDKMSLTVDIRVPVSKKKERSIEVGSKRQEVKTNVVPATVSSFTHMRSSSSFQDGHFLRHIYVFTPSVNLLGLVLESEFSCERGKSVTNKDFKRGHTSVVYDWAERALLFQAWDVSSRSGDYCGSPSLCGFSFYKDAARETGGSLSKDISVTLLRTSKIEVYVNENVVKSKENIAPGTYTMTDIPCSYGFNDVKIKITDDTGREQFVQTEAFFDSSFVREGEFSYGGTLGKSEKIAGTVAAGFVKCGIISAVEGSCGFITNRLGRTLSVGAKNRNLLGFFEVRMAHSKYGQDPLKGKIWSISYAPPSVTVLFPISLNVFYEDSDPGFSPYLEVLQSSEERVSTGVLDSSLNQRVVRGRRQTFRSSVSMNNIWGINTGFSYGLEKHAGEKQTRSSINVSRSLQVGDWLFNNLQVNSSLEWVSAPSKSETLFVISLSVPFKAGATCSHQWRNKGGSNTSLYYSSSDNPFGCNASYSKEGAAHAYTGGASYRHARFLANVNGGKSNQSSFTGQVGVETSLAFADGSFAMTNLNAHDGGFVIAVPKGILASEEIGFMNSSARSGWLGGAVLQMGRDVSSFRLDLESLPTGVEVDKDTIVARGGYRRGAVAEVSAEGSYVAQGILLDSKKAPIGMVSGFAISRTKPGSKPILFFMNENGRFVITNLNPGKYTVSVNVEGYADFEITISESKSPFIDLGTIICKDS
ncbi:MAG: fimbria/pilus outer membrane usher protein [Holosporales bacterium]|jgi:outer membrane usher protein FimD/PapC|nr:fimbria/pilus outer membrane usher protein [Holosporales bacterium]